VISDFVEKVYGRTLSDISDYISKCYEAPIERHERIQDHPTAHLLNVYRDLKPEMAAFPSGFEEEASDKLEEIGVHLPIDIEDELENRGYDPSHATDVVPPARRPLELKPTEYSVEDTYIDITLIDNQELIGWDHDHELSFGVELLDYYAYNGSDSQKPPKQATAILLMDGTVVDTEQITPVPKVGSPREMTLSYTLDEDFYSTPVVQIRYGILVEGEQRYHMSIRDESVLNMIPVAKEFTEAKFRLSQLTMDDRSQAEVIDTLRVVRSKVRYIEKAIKQLEYDTDGFEFTDLDGMNQEEILDEVGRLADIIRNYHQTFGLDENSETEEHHH
jgi:hypothetical protein